LLLLLLHGGGSRPFSDSECGGGVVVGYCSCLFPTAAWHEVRSRVTPSIQAQT
jgi:hypothetical protein